MNQTLAKLYILQGSEWAGVNVPEGSFIGRYEVHYDDNSVETIYIVKGKDVRDWWNTLHSKPVSRGKVIWIGQNPATKGGDRVQRLYLCVWENPQPGKKVLGIDFISTNTTIASPFCLAITAEAAK